MPRNRIHRSHSLGPFGDRRGAPGRRRYLSLPAPSPVNQTESTYPRPPRSPISAYRDPHNRYKILEFLAEGGEGSCLLVQRRSDNKLHVCKVSKRARYDRRIPKEVKFLRDILPPNDRIVKFRSLLITPQTTQIYLDYYNGGDLADLIDNYYINYAKIPESFIWHALLHIAEAVAFLHYGYDRHSHRPTQRDWKKVIHRDIKPPNILLRLPKTNSRDRDFAYPSLVLADFGLATLKPISAVGGTPIWQPPETPEASLAGDCWAVGAIIHAMALGGRPPVDEPPEEYTPRSREMWYRSRSSRRVYPINKLYSHELEDCMFGALTFDPWKRFNAMEILTATVDHYESNNEVWEPLGYWAFDDF